MGAQQPDNIFELITKTSLFINNNLLLQTGKYDITIYMATPLLRPPHKERGRSTPDF